MKSFKGFSIIMRSELERVMLVKLLSTRVTLSQVPISISGEFSELESLTTAF